MDVKATVGKKYRLAILNSHPIQYFAPLYRRIAACEDIDITVFYCSRQGIDKGFRDMGFGQEIVWDIPLLEGYRWDFLKNIGGDRGVNGFLSLINISVIVKLWRGRYDAIIIHGHNSFTNLIAIVSAKLFNTAVFMRTETHLLLERKGLKKALRKPLLKLFYKMCDACLYIGSRNKEFYKYHELTDEKLFFVPYTVDNVFFMSRANKPHPHQESFKKELGVSSDTPIILYSSKLISRKRPMDLLKAYEGLRRRGIKAALVFIGDGPERQKLEVYIASKGVPDVHFVGFKNQSELPEYYAQAHVFVLPSENEPWGLVINEVMSAGVPVITTFEVGASADLVQLGETGFVFQTGDISSLEQYLGEILSDPLLQERMSSRCVEMMHTWSYDQCITGIREALKTVTGNSREKDSNSGGRQGVRD